MRELSWIPDADSWWTIAAQEAEARRRGEDEAARARLTVCRLAGSAEEARPVLEALGLIEPKVPSPKRRSKV